MILRISGRITRDDLNMLRTLLEHERSALAIDLKDDLIVDREAVQLMAVRESNQDELRNCPAYLRDWVMKERTQMSRE